MNPILEPNELELFRDWVAQHLGLQFDHDRLDQLSHALEGQLFHTKFPNISTYLNHLESSETHQEELANLIKKLTVTETYFFRHPDQFQAFIEVALSERMQLQSKHRRLRFLSAGCATGEEAYTQAMLMSEKLPDFQSWDIRVLGVDINKKALKKAEEAKYTSWSMRGMPDEMMRRHFQIVGKEFVLDESIRRVVSFEKRNLASPTNESFWQEEFDVIFCRNVLMYFTPEATRKVIARLTQALVPGGFLFLGPAETLRGLSTEYHLRHTHDTFYYQRRRSEETPVFQPLLEWEPSPTKEVSQPEDTSWMDTISQAAERIDQLSQLPTLNESTQGTGQVRPLPIASHSNLPLARELVFQNRFEEAYSMLQLISHEERQSRDVQLLSAVILTNRGQVDEAERHCKQVLAGDELNAEAHYLLALCREHVGDWTTALEETKTAIYLSPQFAMPYLHQGLLFKRSGDMDTAREAFRKAASLLPLEDVSRILLFGGGFTREALLQLCQSEIRQKGENP